MFCYRFALVLLSFHSRFTLVSLSFHSRFTLNLAFFQALGLTEGQDNMICKMEPYNICYALDEEGNLTIEKQRPIRLLRIY